MERTETAGAETESLFTEVLPAWFRKEIGDRFQDVSAILPATPLQNAMLSAANETSNTSYYNQIILTVHGNTDALKAAWAPMVERHAILRTRFVPTPLKDHPFAQIVLMHACLPWQDATSDTLDAKELAEASKKANVTALDSPRPPWVLTLYSKLDGTGRALVLSMPHALYDSASLAILLREVESVYRRQELVSPVSFEPFLKAIPSLADAEVDEYWKRHLSGFEPTAFPDLTGKVSLTRNLRIGFNVTDYTFDLSLSRIRSSCKENECSLLSLCQAAWVKLLSVYLGELDICFGNVVSGRTVPVQGIDKLVAPCFNTLPVRVDLDPQCTSHQMMGELNQINIQSLPYQLTPLRQLQAAFSPSHHPLFDTLVILQQPIVKLDGGIWDFEADTGEMDFTLVCEFVPNIEDDVLRLRLHSKCSALLESDIPVVLATLNEALECNVLTSRTYAFDFNRLDVSYLSHTNHDYTLLDVGEESLLHSAFERIAREDPNKIALDFLDAKGQHVLWSYKQLNDEAYSIACRLLREGVELEQPVPVHLPKSPAFYASILGVLKAGATFSPFDPQAPAKRKSYMLAELNAGLIISDAQLDNSWSNKHIVYLSEVEDAQLDPSFRKPRGLTPSHLAYHIYTSGSTGKPKAVSVEHRNAVQTLAASKSLIRWSSNSRILQYASSTFDMCYFDVFMALSYGFCICSAPQESMFNNLPAIINSLAVTMLDLTPSVASSISKSSVPSVELLYCIGETMPQSLVDEWSGHCVNSYGPSEAAMAVSIYPVDKSAKSTIFGKPFPTTSFQIRQKHSTYICPVLGVGELYLGGLQLARGYYANENMTNDHFVQDGCQRYYKTGDLVRQMGDGNYDFVRRSDSQVKIRGLRVELGEIDSVIRSASEDIAETSTQVIRASKTARDQLVTFMSLKSSSEKVSHSAVKKLARDHAVAKLPAYMIPTVILILYRLPLSAAGKADQRALKKIYKDSTEAACTDTGVALDRDWTETQREVRSVMSDLSSVPVAHIMHNTSMFSLGLDSLNAVQIASELEKRGFVTSASKVMQAPNLEGIAGATSKRREIPKRPGGVYQKPTIDLGAFDALHRAPLCRTLGLLSTSIAAIRPCTSLQAGMIAQLLRSKGSSYIYHAAFELDNCSDLVRLKEAWDVVFEKHEMLRTGFAATSERQYPFAMITYRARPAELPVTISSTDILDVYAWRSQVTSDVVSNLHRIPWRAILQSAGTTNFMYLSIFHALYDATSLRIIFADVIKAYKDELPLAPSAFLDRPLSNILQANQSDDSNVRRFWESLGNGVSVNKFPDLSSLRSSEHGFAVARRRSSRSLSYFHECCRAADVTMQAAGLAAWAKILSAYIGDTSVIFGTVLSGRNDRHAESAVFPCITTVPVIVDTSQDDKQILRSLMRFAAIIQDNQSVPLTKIQRWLGRTDDKLFDSIFVFQKQVSQNDEVLWRTVDEEVAVEYPLSIEIEPNSRDELMYCLTFRKESIPLAQSATILEQLDECLKTILAPPRRNNAAQSYSPQLYSITPAKDAIITSGVALLHEFVETRALSQPSSTAFEFYTSISDGKGEKRSWSYAELNKVGNRVAHLLKSSNVQQRSIVVICFNKCPEASFIMLGIQKAGCAFLAIDPGAPAARKKFIVEDSQAAAIITTKDLAKSFEDKLACKLVVIDNVDLAIFPSSKPILGSAIRPQDTSYCLYTSGTTGTPKGCELSHSNAVQFILAFKRLLKRDEHSRFLQFASFHFDVSVMEQYWSWSVGICVISAPRDLLFEDLPGAIRSMAITHIDLTPSLARLLHPHEVPSLTGKNSVFITGGEKLQAEIINSWGHLETIYNGYGPTEVTIGCTMYPRVPTAGLSSNIGPQYDNVGSFVLKPNTQEPVLRGAIGELCVSGPLVAKGYLNRPDLTAERFPSIEINGGTTRVYRTGDLVRILHDGSFEFIGRADDQVKLRGQRLEIGEINAIIKASHQDVRDVITVILKHPEQQKKQLITFVTAKGFLDARQVRVADCDQGRRMVATIQEACRVHLPNYMIPTHTLSMTSLPLSANNKTDVSSLKQLYFEIENHVLERLDDTKAKTNGHLTEDEAKVANIVAQYVDADLSSVKSYTSVFELGLDSVSAIGLANTLRRYGYKHASTSNVMKNATVGQLARVLGVAFDKSATLEDTSVQLARQRIAACEHQFKPDVTKALGVSHDDIEHIAPCTPLQQGIISRAMENEGPLYFAEFRFDLLKTTDTERLRAASERVVEKVQILRTKFVETNEGHVQVVVKHANLHWAELEVQSADGASGLLEDQHTRWWQCNHKQLHDPWRIVIAKYPNGRKLSLNIFHGLYDGISLPFIVQSLIREYHKPYTHDYGPVFHDVLPFGPLRIVDGAQSFWLEHLKCTSSFRRLPSLMPEPAAEDTIFETNFPLPDGLEACRRALNTTHQALVQACWAAVLQKHFGGPVTIGIVVSGRTMDVVDAQRVIGPLFNTVPFHLSLVRSSSWAKAVQACHSFNTAAIPYQHTPLRDIMKWCRQLPSYNSQPLFETLFVFKKDVPHGRDDDFEPIWQEASSTFSADYPLSLEAELTIDGALHLSIVGKALTANREFLQRLAEDLDGALQALIAEPEALVTQTIRISEMSRDHEQHYMVEYTELSGAANGHANGHDHAKPNFEWTTISRRIRDEVASLCGVDPINVGPSTSILELGLDSIDAVKLSSRLKRAAGLQLPVSKIMRSLTVATMSDQATSTELDSDAAPTRNVEGLAQHVQLLRQHLKSTNVDTTGVEKILPVTPLQEALIAQILATHYVEYFNHDVMKIREGTNIERLQRAWQDVVDQSPILRTTFQEINDPSISTSYAQLVHHGNEIRWRDEVGSIEEIDRFTEQIRNEYRRASQGQPPFSLTLVREVPSQRPGYLILSLSHALYDGYSLGLLHKDVQLAYAGLFEPRPSYEPKLGAIVTETSRKEAREFWQSVLEGATPTDFPVFDQSDEQQTAVYRKELLSNVKISSAQDFCKTHGITIGALVETVWSCVFASYAHKLDVVFGAVLSCRDDEEEYQIMFPTMNTVAVRSVIHGSLRDMLKYMQDNRTAVMPYKHYPLRKAQALIGHGGSRLSNSLFIYQKRPDADVNDDQIPLYDSIRGASDLDYPVCVEVEALGTQLIWRNACRGGYFGEAGAEYLLHQLDEVLERILSRPEEPALVFDKGLVSICGLPSFLLKTSPEALSTEVDVEKYSGDVNDGISQNERVVQQVLAQVARVPESDVSSTSTIFNLGLDSISAIKVSSLLRKKGLKLSVSDMLKAGTVTNMARKVYDMLNSNRVGSDHGPACEGETAKMVEATMRNAEITSPVSKTGMQQTEIDSVLPATAGQAYMLSLFAKYGIFYATFEYYLYGDISMRSLHSAWNSLVAANAILRTSFVSAGSEGVPFMQVVQKHVNSEFMEASIDAGEAVPTIVGNPTPFVALQAVPKTDHWLLTLNIHHALYDGLSLPLLLERFEALCDRPVQSQAVPLTGTLVESIASISLGPSYDDRKNFWCDYLSGIESKPLPQGVDTDRRVQPRSRVEVYTPEFLNGANTRNLKRTAQNANVSIQALFVAIYARVYTYLTTRNSSSSAASRQNHGAALPDGRISNDVLIGIYLANRSSADLETFAYPMLNLVPLRVRSPSRRSLLDIARNVQADLERVSEGNRSALGLWELENWLDKDVCCDTWVNFVNDTGSEAENMNGTPSRAGIQAAEIRESEMSGKRYSEGYERVREPSYYEGIEHQRRCGKLAQKLLADDRIRACYVASIDVEATVRDGKLAVGLFCDEDLLNLPEVKLVRADLRHEIMMLIKHGQ